LVAVIGKTIRNVSLICGRGYSAGAALSHFPSVRIGLPWRIQQLDGAPQGQIEAGAGPHWQRMR
jgi:hypothetical protein